MKKYTLFSITLLFLFLSCGCSLPRADAPFNGDNAYQHVQAQLAFGARIPGSEAIRNTAAYLSETLQNNDWNTLVQSFDYKGVSLQNIIAKKGNGEEILLLATHYDTRSRADRDIDSTLREHPVLGANDGASGTAVLLELGRVLTIPDDTQVWLVFFDGEDQGNINGWEWSIGADYFVQHLEQSPDKVIIIDMIGDSDLNIYQEQNSNEKLVREIWSAAEQLAYHPYFIPELKYAMIDDHLPFLNHAIPAALLIDFDYAYWHTTHDTIENVSSNSLQIVGDVLCHWLENTP